MFVCVSKQRVTTLTENVNIADDFLDEGVMQSLNFFFQTKWKLTSYMYAKFQAPTIITNYLNTKR